MQKESQIDKLNEELRSLRSTVKSQETTISYFRKKTEELNKQVELEKADKIQMQSEMRRIEHMSSKHDSPRSDKEDEEFKKTQDLINQAQNLIDTKFTGSLTNINSESSPKYNKIGRPTIKKKESSVIISDGQNNLELGR